MERHIPDTLKMQRSRVRNEDTDEKYMVALLLRYYRLLESEVSVVRMVKGGTWILKGYYMQNCVQMW